MNAEERDELLIRVDERLSEIQKKCDRSEQVQEKMEAHLRELNGSVAKNVIDISKNTTARRIGMWISGAMMSFLIAILVKLVSIG